MELDEIEYPKHLDEHTLSAQELALMTEQQRPLAKDWNVINRKMDWILRDHVLLRNAVAQQGRLLKKWEFTTWLVGGLLAVSGLIFALLKYLH